MQPNYLKTGDEIRIISPSGAINPIFIDGAIKVLSEWGLSVTEGKYARTEFGRFAGTEKERTDDLQAALNDHSVKAILCSRGGYGLAQIIDKLDFSEFQHSPKWLIGFSDITILHSALSNFDTVSIHGIMAKHLTELSQNSEPVGLLKEMLFGKMPKYIVAPSPENRYGAEKGKLVGGNLSVLMGLRGTPYDLDYNHNILFIEDIGEQPYHIDRMMQNFRMSGKLAQLSGLLVGQFSECPDDPSMKQSISEIIMDAVKEYNFPVLFNFPAGHVDYNLPLPMGATVEITISENGGKIEVLS